MPIEPAWLSSDKETISLNEMSKSELEQALSLMTSAGVVSGDKVQFARKALGMTQSMFAMVLDRQLADIKWMESKPDKPVAGPTLRMQIIGALYLHLKRLEGMSSDG